MYKNKLILLYFLFIYLWPIPSLSDEQFVVSPKELNVRVGPGTKFGKTDKISQGDSVVQLEQKEIEPGVIWVKIGYDNKIGWVNKKFLVNPQSEPQSEPQNNENYLKLFLILIFFILATIFFHKKKKKAVLIEIRASVIQVEGSLYPVNKISGVKYVSIKQTFFESIFVREKKHAILIRTDNDYFLLVGGNESEKINELFYMIRDAIDANSRGITYLSEVKINGDIINQKGNFGVGYNSGEVSMSDVIKN